MVAWKDDLSTWCRGELDDPSPLYTVHVLCPRQFASPRTFITDSSIDSILWIRGPAAFNPSSNRVLCEVCHTWRRNGCGTVCLLCLDSCLRRAFGFSTGLFYFLLSKFKLQANAVFWTIIWVFDSSTRSLRGLSWGIPFDHSLLSLLPTYDMLTGS